MPKKTNQVKSASSDPTVHQLISILKQLNKYKISDKNVAETLNFPTSTFSRNKFIQKHAEKILDRLIEKLKTKGIKIHQNHNEPIKPAEMPKVEWLLKREREPAFLYKEEAEDEILKEAYLQEGGDVKIIHTTNHNGKRRLNKIENWVKGKSSIKILLVHPNSPEFFFQKIKEGQNKIDRSRFDFIEGLSTYLALLNNQNNSNEIQPIQIQLYKSKPTVKLYIFERYIYYKTHFPESLINGFSNFYVRIPNDKNHTSVNALTKYFDELWKANNTKDYILKDIEQIKKFKTQEINNNLANIIAPLKQKYLLFNVDEQTTDLAPISIQTSFVEINLSTHECTLEFSIRNSKKSKKVDGRITYFIDNQISLSFREKEFSLELSGTFPKGQGIESKVFAEMLYIHFEDIRTEKLPKSTHALLIDANKYANITTPNRDTETKINTVPPEIRSYLLEKENKAIKFYKVFKNLEELEGYYSKNIESKEEEKNDTLNKHIWENYSGRWLVYSCERYSKEKAININPYLGLINQSVMTINEKDTEGNISCTFDSLFFNINKYKDRPDKKKDYDKFSLNGNVMPEKGLGSKKNLICSFSSENTNFPSYLQLVFPMNEGLDTKEIKSQFHGMFLVDYRRDPGQAFASGLLVAVKYDDSDNHIEFEPKMIHPEKMNYHFKKYPFLKSLLPKHKTTLKFSFKDLDKKNKFIHYGKYKVYSFSRKNPLKRNSIKNDDSIHIGILTITPYQTVLYEGKNKKNQAVGYAFYNGDENLFVELKHQPIKKIDEATDRLSSLRIKIDTKHKPNTEKGTNIFCGIMSGLSYYRITYNEPYSKKIILEFIDDSDEVKPQKVSIQESKKYELIDERIREALSNRKENLIGFLAGRKNQFNWNELEKENKHNETLNHGKVYFESGLYRLKSKKYTDDEVLEILKKAISHGYFKFDEFEIELKQAPHRSNLKEHSIFKNLIQTNGIP